MAAVLAVLSLGWLSAALPAIAKNRDPDTSATPIPGGVRPAVEVTSDEPGQAGYIEGSGEGPSCAYTRIGGGPSPDLDYPFVPRGGGSGGSVPYKYDCSDGSAGVIWITPTTGGGAPAIDPKSLADQASKDLVLPEPSIRMNPDPERGGVVTQIPLWLWVDPSTWGDRSKTASVAGVSVTAMATPERVTFDMGNGDQVVCRGSGTPYDSSRREADQRTECSYAFRHTSAARPDQRYHVTATVAWHVTWSVSGAPAPANPDLGVIERSSSVAIRVAEIQSINN